MKLYLKDKEGKPGQMKINRKIHNEKGDNGKFPIRAYVSGINTITQRVAGLVEKELDEGVRKQKR